MTASMPESDAHRATESALSARHRRVGLICAGVAIGMVGMSYAAVPLYQIFCQVTGYGGTPQVASAPSERSVAQSITMRFDANVSRGLEWDFKPVERTSQVRLGENRIAVYTATNTSDKPLRGTATFNVSPDAAGVFFNKIECFCFTEQLIEPGQTVEMPVSYFVDPDMLADKDAGHISQITLSYTFFPMDEPKKSAEHRASSVEPSDTRG